MGLDMYLNRESTISKYSDSKKPVIDGFEIKGHLFEFGYWKGLLSLHEYIVNNFGNGFNDQHIYLDQNDLERIITAIKKKDIQDDFNVDDLEPFKRAINWLEKEQNGVWKHAVYEASW